MQHECKITVICAEEAWRGQNILGFALMEVRSILRKTEEYDD